MTKEWQRRALCLEGHQKQLDKSVPMKFFCIRVALVLIFFVPCHAEDPTYWQWAPTPPMGWNSYDGFGDSVTEAEVMANASFVKDQLLIHGWNMIVVDYRWYDPGAHGNRPQSRKGAQLSMDQYGRLLPLKTKP